MKNQETQILDEIKKVVKLKATVQRARRIWVSTDSENLLTLCTWLKDHGFAHLSAISATDWLEKGYFEVTYHVWSYTDKLLITVKTTINRKKPSIESVTQIWGENAQIHERELHELFGVNFKGNDDLAPLFLDNWQGPPPFMKDFDWRTYVQEKFYDKNNEREQVYYDE